MKKLFLFLILWIFTLPLILAQPVAGVRVSVQLKENAAQKVYLGSYYGKFQTLLDSIQLDLQGKGQFLAEKKYVPGIYFLVSHKKQLLFEFLMDLQQQFSISQESLTAKPVITGSVENENFLKYNRFVEERYPLINTLQEKLKTASSADSSKFQLEIRVKSAELDNYRSEFLRQHPQSLLAFLFKALRQVDVPDSLRNPKPHQLSYLRDYLREHYWDGMDLTDDRLLRTPFYDARLITYLEQYVSPEPDAQINAVKPLLSRANQKQGEQFRYLLTRLTDKYINPTVMGQDKVFLYLFNQYYARENYTWLNEKQKKYLFDRAYSLMSNQIGDPAPVLNLVGVRGEPQQLYRQKAKYSLVVFWDPGCGHCQKELPRLDSVYRASWKAKGLGIFAVNVDDVALLAWKEFIARHRLEEWTHAYQPEVEKLEQQKKQVPNFRQLYDVTQTPTLYLLDENKKIVAKKLDLTQLDKLLTQLDKGK